MTGPASEPKTGSAVAWRRLLRRIKGWLPQGHSLPDEQWANRHRVVLVLLWLHAGGLAVMALLRGFSPAHALSEGTVVAVCAAIASGRHLSRTTRSAVAGLGLVMASAIFVHLSGGLIEAHFHFFVVLSILTLYQEWVPYLIALAFVVLHHGTVGWLDPHSVYNHPGAIDHPWRWAAIHGAFVLAASVANLVAWRMTEEARSELEESYCQLRRSEERFRSLVQKSSDLTLVCDADGALTYVSPASEGILGVENVQVAERTIGELVHPEDQAVFRQRLRSILANGGEGPTLECRVARGDGSYIWAEATVTDLLNDPAVQGVVINLRDVSDRRRLETQLRHAQKMESVGQLAAGIAHEMNTPIQFVGDNVRFVQEAVHDLGRVLDAYREASLAADPTAALAECARVETEVNAAFLAAEMPEAVEQTLEGVDRVATIVRAMKGFAHPSTEDKAPADLNQAIRNTVVVANNELKYVADVVLELADLPSVWCHLGDVNQVILNLVVNAAHAIRDLVGDSGQRGRITIRTAQDGDSVTIDVIDTGMGIPSNIADRVFEPFFTTKPVGLGTGQGLALAYSLVHDRHGGSITFASVPGAGTTFTVRLPVAPSARTSAAADVLAG